MGVWIVYMMEMIFVKMGVNGAVGPNCDREIFTIKSLPPAPLTPLPPS